MNAYVRKIIEMSASADVYHVETPIYNPYPRGVVPETDVAIKKHPIPMVVIWMLKIVILCNFMVWQI